MNVIRSRSQSSKDTECKGLEAGSGGCDRSPMTQPAAPCSLIVLRAPGTAAERRQEEQDQRDQQDVDHEGLDEDETQDQRAADVTGRAGIPRDGFRRRRNRLALAERAER